MQAAPSQQDYAERFVLYHVEAEAPLEVWVQCFSAEWGKAELMRLYNCADAPAAVVTVKETLAG